MIDHWAKDGLSDPKPLRGNRSELSDFVSPPRWVRARRDILFYIEYIEDGEWPHQLRSWVIREGERAEYFPHSGTYAFHSRDGVVPYFPRKLVEQQPDFFEPLEG